MPRNTFGLTGVASSDLSLGMPSMSGAGLGDMLRDQVDKETEEEKRKRRLGLSTLQQASPAVASIFGGGGFGASKG